jgi:membrane-bound lytic murein transglycosylase MltF
MISYEDQMEHRYMISNEERFDLAINDHVERLFPSLLLDLGPYAWLWVKAQIWQESRMNPNAISPAGAVGLMQLMPATDLEIDGDLDGADVIGNIDNGVRYLARQYEKLLEIPAPAERLRFALASYNGGRGYINKALELSREACGLAKSFTAWNKAGRPAGQWQAWAFAHAFLADERCRVKGKTPDHVQICGYVAHIETRYRYYTRRQA